jgi:PPOX class probable F420-dependent enzyme
MVGAMDQRAAMSRVREARVGRFASADARGVPHVVPFVFVLAGETLYWAVDRKPKRSVRIKRIDNIRANPKVEVVVDHYDEDWNELWWVRAAGIARVLEGGDEFHRAIELLTQKYPQYRRSPPDGPVVAIDIVRWSGWEARAGAEGSAVHEDGHARGEAVEEVPASDGADLARAEEPRQRNAPEQR